MKKNLLLSFAACTMLAATVFTSNAQQLKVPAPSPQQTVKQAFALSEITIEYSRPSVKNRVIFGDLVPFGKTWRTGANQATKITFGEDVKIEGKPVTAGTYALYTIPNKDSWEVMLYKDLTLGGDVAEYKMENEVVRVKVPATTSPVKVETFTIGVNDITSKTAKIEFAWDMTRVAVNVAADIDVKIMKNIETSLANDSRPYYQAANYYYENDKDMNQALQWVNKAAEANAKAYWIMHLKAKIHMKMNDKPGAIAAAEKSLALATEDKNDDFVKLNEKLIAEAKKK